MCNENHEIIIQLIDNLKKRLEEKYQNRFDLYDLKNMNSDEFKKKFLVLMLQSCVSKPQEVFSSFINICDSKIPNDELLNFINFCDLNIQAQNKAYEQSKREYYTAEERHTYLAKLYLASKKDIEQMSQIHNPANSLEEIEYTKAKKTDKIERTFQQMINDMVYLVDFLNRNITKKKRTDE